MNIIDGKLISSKLKEECKLKVSKMEKKPYLAMIHIGDDAAAAIYTRLKGKVCTEIGIPFVDYALKKDITQDELLAKIDELNKDSKVTGILVESPIPNHLDISQAFDAIDPKKDVDGLNSISQGKLAGNRPTYIPATPQGIITLLKEYRIDIAGKNCVVIGRSNIVGRPMAMALLNEHGTVTICHSRTKDLAAYTREADILIVAIGKPKFITADMVKEGAVVIDVGINRMQDTGKIVGDVDFESVSEKCSFITPVPGGVGPMTIVSLMQNLIKSVE